MTKLEDCGKKQNAKSKGQGRIFHTRRHQPRCPLVTQPTQQRDSVTLLRSGLFHESYTAVIHLRKDQKEKGDLRCLHY